MLESFIEFSSTNTYNIDTEFECATTLLLDSKGLSVSKHKDAV